MKKDYEAQVMGAFYGLNKIFGIEQIRFNLLAEFSGIKKGTLQRILPRLEKRYWIERKDGWFSPSGILTYDVKNKIILEPLLEFKKALESKNDYRPARSSRSGLSMKTKKILLKSTLKKYTPKKYSFYKLIMFPFIFAIKPDSLTEKKFIKISKNWNVPNGTKRFWKQVAKLTKELVKKEKNRRNNRLKAYQEWANKPEEPDKGKFTLKEACPVCFDNGSYVPVTTNQCSKCGYNKIMQLKKPLYEIPPTELFNTSSD